MNIPSSLLNPPKCTKGPNGGPCRNVMECRECHVAAAFGLIIAKGAVPGPEDESNGRIAIDLTGPACRHWGAPTGVVRECRVCTKTVLRDEHQCTCPGHGPTVDNECLKCPDHSNRVARREEERAKRRARQYAPGSPRSPKWACGVTTVPSRRGDLLPRTLASLKAAGFPDPQLFVDGDRDPSSWEREFKLAVTCHWPALKIAGSWVLAMYEMLIRNPTAHMFAMFQDDLVACRGLREYLDELDYPDKVVQSDGKWVPSAGRAPGYWNLYTFPQNMHHFKVGQTGRYDEGFYPSGQNGWGAVALVFSRRAVVELLSHENLTVRPLDATERRFKAIDGGIVTTMNKAGWLEYVHNPSLVQHTGEISSMGNRRHPQADTFKGEEWNALELLGFASADKVA